MDPTRVYIDTAALAHNIAQVRAIIGPGRKLIAMVKANAYGHGMEGVSRLAVAHGADMLAVARVDEAAALREAQIEAPILVTGGVLPAQMAQGVGQGFIQAAYTQEQLEALAHAAAQYNKPARVHIKVDTGMHRTGVRPGASLDALLSLAAAHPAIQVEGAFTHFAVADEAESPYTQAQYDAFLAAARQFSAHGFSPMLHADNSAGTVSGEHDALDGVRAGIALYGLSPAAACRADLRPVLSWKTNIVALGALEAGETLSYGRTYMADRPMRIATLPVGYADGYRRELSNKGFVLVGGQRAAVVGTVCMDHIMADVTEIPGVEIGDEAVLIGQQGENVVMAQNLAELCGTIHYEIITCIGQRIPRIYV